MPPQWVHNPLDAALPDHCEPTSEFLVTLSSYFHTCLPTPLALISSTLGTLSIVSWLFAQLPQIYKNYNLQSTSGLSIYFLVEWCLGDSTNLIGAVLTNQASWQVIIASYYVLVDVILVLQYYWYTYIKPWRLAKVSYVHSAGRGGSGAIFEAAPPSEDSSVRRMSPISSMRATEPKDVTTGSSLKADYSPNNSASVRYEKTGSSCRTIIRSSGNSSTASLASPRAMLFVSMLFAVLANASSPDGRVTGAHHLSEQHESAAQIAGRISSWFSTALYLASRLPQLFKNYRRKSTTGLSPLLFFAAFCGNFFYSTSLLTNPNGWSDFPPYGGRGWAGQDGNNRWEWVRRATPFWLGAAGVLALDAAMGIQFMIYRDMSDEIIVKMKNNCGRGRSKWRRVSGWMRGWIPSVSPGPKAPTGETESLLHHGHDRYGAV